MLLHRLSHDPLSIIRQNLAWSSRLRWIDGHFVFVPFLNNCTSSCHLLIKLMVNLVPDVLWQILGLILICQRTETDSVRRRALYRYEVAIRRIYNWLTDCNLVLCGHTGNLWEPEFWLCCRGSNTYLIFCLSSLKWNYHKEIRDSNDRTLYTFLIKRPEFESHMDESFLITHIRRKNHRKAVWNCWEWQRNMSMAAVFSKDTFWIRLGEQQFGGFCCDHVTVS